MYCLQYGPRYPWNAYDQSLLLGAYFWGYAITSFPCGILADKYGFAKNNIFYAYVASVILTCLAPIAAASFAWSLTLRFALGFVTV